MYSSFEDLEVYKTTIKLTAKVYDLLKESLERRFCNG